MWCCGRGSCATHLGVWTPSWGPVPYNLSGLQFVKIPLLMGELPKDRIASVSHRLSRIVHAVQRLRPSYSLVRRILLAFGVSPLDYLTEAMPIPGDAVGGCQLLVDRIATMTLGIPRSALKCALYCPVAAGGFGVPHLGLGASCVSWRACAGL